MSDPYTLSPPNVRQMIIPDPGYVLVEADLARADAQVAAWDADCQELKVIFQRGDDIHSDNARLLYGRDINPRAVHVNGMTFRDNAKRAVHLADYAGGANVLSQSCSLSREKAEQFLSWWCRREHPAIGEWHDRRHREISRRKHPIATNAFGFRRIYTDRTDRLLGQFLAWICQSTVSVVISKAMKQVDCAEDIFGRPRCGSCVKCRLPWFDLLLQVHDSLLTQVREDKLAEVVPALLAAMAVPVPYPDPLVIPAEIKWSPHNWASMEKWQ